MEIIEIFYILLLLSASVLCIALIFYLNRITKSIGVIEADIKDLSSQLKPLIASTKKLSEKLNDLALDAKDQVKVLKSIVTDVRERADTILELEENVREKVEENLFDVIKNITAVTNGVNAFWNAYTTKKDKSKNTVSPST